MNKAGWLIVIVLLCGCASSVKADHIRIKNTFWGWKFAVDSCNGGKFRGTGGAGGNLKPFLAGDSVALSELDQYKKQITVSNVVAAPGCVLIGWAFVETFGQNNHSKGDMLALATLPFLLVSYSFYETANDHMERAVYGFNKRADQKSQPPQVSLYPTTVGGKQLALGISIHF